MKKRTILILFVIIISAGLMYFGKELQNFYNSKQEAVKINNEVSQAVKPNDEVEADAKVDNINKETDDNKNDAANKANSDSQQETKEPPPSSSKNTSENSSTNQSKNTNTSTNTNTNTSSTAANNQTQQPNFFIVDTVYGKKILAPEYTEYNGETVAQITCKILDASNISYKTSGFGNTIYFSSINGIREREAGSLSGWCFFVNGKKSNLGAGAYKLSKGDVLEWKYLKDGVSG